MPCAIFVVPLHSHSALESHSRYRSTKSAGDQGLCSPQKSEIFGVPKKDAPHAHRTFIALSPHTRIRVAAMSPAGVPVAPRRVPVACGVPKGSKTPSVPLMRGKMVARTKNNFGNLEKFCLLKYKSKQVYLVLFFLFTPARFIPNPLVPAPRSYLSGGHGGN